MNSIFQSISQLIQGKKERKMMMFLFNCSQLHHYALSFLKQSESTWLPENILRLTGPCLGFYGNKLLLGCSNIRQNNNVLILRSLSSLSFVLPCLHPAQALLNSLDASSFSPQNPGIGVNLPLPLEASDVPVDVHRWSPLLNSSSLENFITQNEQDRINFALFVSSF